MDVVEGLSHEWGCAAPLGNRQVFCEDAAWQLNLCADVYAIAGSWPRLPNSLP